MFFRLIVWDDKWCRVSDGMVSEINRCCDRYKQDWYCVFCVIIQTIINRIKKMNIMKILYK